MMFEARRRDWINTLLAFSQGMLGWRNAIQLIYGYVCAMCICACGRVCIWVCLLVCVHMHVCIVLQQKSLMVLTKIFQVWFPEREKGLTINWILVKIWGLLVSLIPAGRGKMELPQASNKERSTKIFPIRDQDHSSLTSLSQSEVCLFIFP